MSYYPAPGAPYVPQQPVNPYGGMGTVGLATSLPNTQMQQAQQQRPQPMNGQQPVQQSAQDGGWLLGRPVSSREEFLAIPSDLYGRPTYCPDLRSGVIYCKRLNPDTCESYVQEFYSPEAWRQMQAQQAQQTAAPTQQYAGRISNEEADWIAAYAKKKSLKVYAIGGIQKCADRFVDCSPFEVLAYFRNAEEVITDTFHGSIFSVITHRPFTTLIRKSVGNSYGNEEKLSDLLNRLGLTERMTTKVEDTERINQRPIDYEKVDDVLQKQREVAKKYLQKNIEG